jgi:hypothetical protein
MRKHSARAHGKTSSSGPRDSFEFVINVKSALSVAATLLSRADEIIERSRARSERRPLLTQPFPKDQAR